MNLPAVDLNYIDHRMKMYDIKYQEIYDEIRDHVISAIETARASGDQRNIVTIFDDMMSAQFPGYYAFEDISKQYEGAYRKKIRKIIWSNFVNYLTIQSVLPTLVLLVIAFYLPHTKVITIAFYIMLSVTAFIPVFYAWLKTRKMNLDDGKQSMVKNHVKRHASLLTLILQSILSILSLIADEWHIVFLKPAHYPPALLMLLLCLFITYSLSIMRLCRQEVNIATYIS